MWTIELLKESDIGEQLDHKLRLLLSKCFPSLPQYAEDRNLFQAPAFRLIIKDGSEVIANLSAHQLKLNCPGHTLIAWGVGDLSVSPKQRSNGLAARLLERYEEVIITEAADFSVLFGDINYYRSKGYTPIANLYKQGLFPALPIPKTLIKAVGSKSWPIDDAWLVGDYF